MSAERPPFHLAFPVTDLVATRAFMVEVLGCGVGRESERWIDFDFHGHQVTAHLVDAAEDAPAINPVSGHAIPVRHFGLVLAWDAWRALVARLRAAGVPFAVEPHIRFPGEAGEQATLFVVEPGGGNAIEFKAFRDPRRLFARE
ncbi:VOC family protein [Thiohalobacter sp.]|uniref:VOC family protein n=1 Tax=Thiohalobacter sp. TaxID=2025948 RepID=UPI0026064413|nr:VOC family protein [Thiohalobacter sp.]